MRNVALFLLSFVVIAISYTVSSSGASVIMSVTTLLLGWLMASLFSKSDKERIEMITVMLASFIVITLAAVLQYFVNLADPSFFRFEGNDNYSFYLSSLEGVGASSIGRIFDECIVQNVHYENGGYYFYIKSLAYLAQHFADGNCILLQQLGTVMPSVLSSVVLFAILSNYCPKDKTKSYTCFFIVLSPLILHSIGIHRDAMIALLYFILIYLWLCKDFSLRIGILQVLIAIVLFYFREQHGLFALSFVIVSLISTLKQKRFVLIVAVMALIAIVGAAYLSDIMSSSLSETNEYYENLSSDRLSGLSSGIGRFVYMLPSPIKEVAQIFFLQLRFPPWLDLSAANNLPGIIMGLLSFAVSFYWFYVFSFTLFGLIRMGYRSLPTKLVMGLVLLFVFLFLSTTNLDSRRVVCMYPLMYIPFVYYNERVLPKRVITVYRRNYSFFYLGICLLYLAVKVNVG